MGISILRQLRFRQSYHISRVRLFGADGPPSAIAKHIAAELRALRIDALPGPLDVQVLVPPTDLAWSRPVRNTPYWLWYAFNDDTRIVVAIHVR